MDETGRHCPDCGAQVAAAFSFCPSCGISLPMAVPTDEDASGSRPEPMAHKAPAPSAEAGRSWRAERRLVSVLFVDLVGFTTMSERLDPEDVREVQSRYFEAARSTVARYGGTLEKFIGDAVMAVWGSPVARENDAERAVRAALEIVAAVGSMGTATPGGGAMAARAAVTTGEAAVSFDLDGEGMVTGDMVNTASRLQESAKPGSVLVDSATRRAVGAAIEFEDAGERSLKGRSSAVSAWRAAAASAPDGTDSVAGHRGPFIGRAAELADLLQLADSAVHGRSTVLVSISGVAGIGKSRLVREVERQPRDGTQLRWYRGRPPRWGEGTAFAPLAEMARRLLGLARGEPEEVVRRTLGAELDRLIPDPGEREWMAARVGVLLGGPADAAGEREELFAAWRRFLEAEADASPIALVFEDLQWADPDTFDFIDYLTTWSHRHPILVLAIARPELLERRPTWGAGVPQFRSMHIDRLTDGEIDELLRALAPQLPEAVAARVRQRAEGVPLYAVEIARMTTEAGRPAATGSDVPESLHALLAARIDSLPVDERTVLLTAAVLGRRFRQESLATLTALPRAELGARIGTLIRREFLAVDDEPSSAGRGQLTFVQDLMREVAYATLSRRDRRRYHEAVIEQLGADDDPKAIEPIAEHLVAAHAAVGGADRDEADALARRATGALRQAADHAESQHAPHRALVHLERALTLAEDATTRAQLAEAAASAARSAARFGVAEMHLRAAIDARDEMGDRVASARDRAHLAGVLLQAQRSDTALAELEAAWSSYADVGGRDAVTVRLAAELARAHMLRQSTAAAVEWAQRAIEAAAQDATDESRASALDAHVSLGTALAQGGRPEEGMAELAAAIDGAAEARIAAIELRARTNLAWLTAVDDPRAGSEIARRGIDLAHQLGSREWLLQLLDIGGILAVETGDWEWALARLHDAMASDLPTTYRLDFAATTAVLHAVRGDPDPMSTLDRLGEHEPDLDPHAFGWSRLARGVGALVGGEFADALGWARRVADDTIGFDRAEALALAGRAAAWSGDAAAAGTALRELEAEPRWGRATEARLLTLRASVDPGADGDPWDGPLAIWRALELPYREALCLADRWMLRGHTADRDAAIGLLEELGASALVSRIADRVPLRGTA
jgi:class 3 adenylate cyclase